MKLRILDRILAALAGLILLCAGAALTAQVFFGADVLGLAQRILSNESFGRRAALGLTAAGLLLLGLYSLMVLFRHRKKKDRFVRQKTENGELAISLKALDQMVRKCLEQHPEMEVQSMELENRRDGLLIRIRSNAAGGISIPLTADALQKEIKQYVTSCSGVEISGIRMEVEMSGAEAANPLFAIPAPSVPRLPRETEQPVPENAVEKAEKKEAEQEEKPAQPDLPTEIHAAVPVETPADTEILSAALLSPDDILPEEEEDDRPMHQRLFSAQPEPCIIPEPPAETEDTAGTEQDAPETEEAGTETEEDTAEAEETVTEAEQDEAEPEETVTEADPDETSEGAKEAVTNTEKAAEETEEAMAETLTDDAPEDSEKQQTEVYGYESV